MDKQKKAMGRPPRPAPAKSFSCDLEEKYLAAIERHQAYFKSISPTGTRPSKGHIIQTALDCLASMLDETTEAGRE